ncbi:MAG: tetratricopeptide repeat protein [Candidatus Omnitrophica bacterium]|nr:tetratricopeptide repeat protein [Candidatus Omnitrophota bacterium]
MGLFSLRLLRYLYICLRAEKLIDKGCYKNAINLIEAFLEKKIYATETIYYILGKAHYGNKNYKLAFESFDLAIENNSYEDINKANTLFYLGLAYYDSKIFDKAIKVFRKSISIKEEIKYRRDMVISLPHVYCYLGRTYARLGRNSEAHDAFNMGLKYEPDNKALKREFSLLDIQRE